MALLSLKFVTDVRDTDYEVVEFHGELDKSTQESAEKQILELLSTYTRHWLILDFSDLKFINSEGIGFLVALHAKLAKKEQQLLICSVAPNVADIFEVIGLGRIIPMFPSIAEAIHYIKKT